MKKYITLAMLAAFVIFGSGLVLAAKDSCCEVKAACACAKGDCCKNGKCTCKGEFCTKDSCKCAEGKCNTKCECQKK